MPAWLGPRPISCWNKPVVGPPWRPFAELQLVEALERQGWTAGWVFREAQFLSTWEPRAFARLPKPALVLHEDIRQLAGEGGCWDIFAWRRGAPLFIESKRRGRDRIQKSQLKWLQAALHLGLPAESFLVAEWTLGHSEDGYGVIKGD